MGQYHILVNVDKQETVIPHGLGLGLKQWEHSFRQGSLPQVLYVLLATSPARGGGDLKTPHNADEVWGRWCGDRVLVLGDYTQDSDVPSIPNVGDLYGYACDEFTDITDLLIPLLETTFGVRVSDSAHGWRDSEIVTNYLAL